MDFGTANGNFGTAKGNSGIAKGSNDYMSFSSLIFTALFLPLFLLIYYIVPGIRQKNRVLLLASLLFYAFSGVRYLILLLVMAVLAWALGRKISIEAAKQSLYVAAFHPSPPEDQNDQNNKASFHFKTPLSLF